MNNYIETERLIHRPFELEDAEDVMKMLADKEVTRYTFDHQGVFSKEDALDLIKNVLQADYKQYGYGRLAVIHKPDNVLIGFSGLKYLPEFAMTDIGYRFLPQYWGKGLATESVLAIMQYAKQQLKLDTIIGMAMPDNIASLKLLEKAGLSYKKDVVEDGILLKYYSNE